MHTIEHPDMANPKITSPKAPVAMEGLRTSDSRPKSATSIATLGIKIQAQFELPHHACSFVAVKLIAHQNHPKMMKDMEKVPQMVGIGGYLLAGLCFAVWPWSDESTIVIIRMCSVAHHR
jgi:hypothetical protein